MDNTPFADPFHLFRFHVDFTESRPMGDSVSLCSGVFSECTGLEATMEPKVIKAGGHNYGDVQRVGPVTFATVILKRGMTRNRDLWKWFEMTSSQNFYSYRLTVAITLFDTAGEGVLAWEFARALPTKFKAADFNASTTDVGIEELHFVHEGLSLREPRRSQLV